MFAPVGFTAGQITAHNQSQNVFRIMPSGHAQYIFRSTRFHSCRITTFLVCSMTSTTVGIVSSNVDKNDDKIQRRIIDLYVEYLREFSRPVLRSCVEVLDERLL